MINEEEKRTIEEAAILDVRRKHPKLRWFAGPIDGRTHAAVLAWLEVVVEISGGVIHVNNSLVAPEIDRDGFQSGHVRTKIGDDRILHMTEAMMLLNFSFRIHEQHSFIARCEKEAWFRFRIGKKFHHRDTVGVGRILTLPPNRRSADLQSASRSN